jgi:hypothetical protein
MVVGGGTNQKGGGNVEVTMATFWRRCSDVGGGFWSSAAVDVGSYIIGEGWSK